MQLLDKIHNDFEQGRICFEEKNSYLSLLREQTETQYIIDAYMKIGKVGIENAKYQKGLIDKAILQYEEELDEILRFSPNVLKDIEEEFEMNVYINKNEIMNRLQTIYDEHGIKHRVWQYTIEDYYVSTPSGSIKGSSYKLTAFKF